jgi:predicted dehydrogenase
MGHVHLVNCVNSPLVELTAAADLSNRALLEARRLGVKKVYKNYEDLLEQNEIEAVIISLPNYLHLSCAKSSAESGKHILLEKPLARNPREGKEILSAVNKAGVKLMIGYYLRFETFLLQAKQHIQDGVLGDIQLAHAVFVDSGPLSHRVADGIPIPVPAWWFDKNLVGGGALLDLGCHLINLLRWYFGDVERITTYLGYRFNLDVEDHAVSIMEFKNKVVATMSVGWFSTKAERSVELYGTTATVNFNANTLARPTVSSRIVNDFKLITRARSIDISKQPYALELAKFIRCIQDDLPVYPSGKEGLSDLQVIENAYERGIINQDSSAR